MVVRESILLYNENMIVKRIGIFFLTTVFFTYLLSAFIRSSFAATASNCLETVIGNPPANAPGGCDSGGGTGSEIGDYADKLQAAIGQACSQYTATFPSASYVNVNIGTQKCIDTIPSLNSTLKNPPLTDVLQVLHTSVNNATGFSGSCYGNLQCVGFTQAVALGTGKALASANAGDFNRDKPGYKWHEESTSNMKAGDIPVWETHIAVTVKTFPDGSYKVAEANGCNTGAVGEETYPPSIPHGASYKLTYLGFLRKDLSVQ